MLKWGIIFISIKTRYHIIFILFNHELNRISPWARPECMTLGKFWPKIITETQLNCFHFLNNKLQRMCDVRWWWTELFLPNRTDFIHVVIRLCFVSTIRLQNARYLGTCEISTIASRQSFIRRILARTEFNVLWFTDVRVSAMCVNNSKIENEKRILKQCICRVVLISLCRERNQLIVRKSQVRNATTRLSQDFSRRAIKLWNRFEFLFRLLPLMHSFALRACFCYWFHSCSSISLDMQPIQREYRMQMYYLFAFGSWVRTSWLFCLCARFRKTSARWRCRIIFGAIFPIVDPNHARCRLAPLHRWHCELNDFSRPKEYGTKDGNLRFDIETLFVLYSFGTFFRDLFLVKMYYKICDVSVDNSNNNIQ